MRSRILVYVAGPYSDHPTARTIEAANEVEWLTKKGYAVFAPHLHWHWFDAMHPHEWAFYMDQCLVMLERCDLLMRLPGASKGADLEVDHATELGIPVVAGRAGLEKWEAK